VPYILQASLQIEREISEDTTVSVGSMWNHGVHLLSGSAYDLNLNPLQGTTTYVVCPANATTAPCSGQTVVLPNMDNGLLTEGRINPNLGQINELISPGQNQYNSFFVQLQHRMSQGLSLQFSYTFAKSIMLDGMDFNNQFDFSNTHSPSLLDQRHRITFASVYRPSVDRLTNSETGRALLSDWRLSSVMEFSSGRPYAALLSPACTSSTLSFNNCDGANGNLNDTAFNQDTANTAAGIDGGGPTPGIGLNSFYGPWLERIDVGLARSFEIREGKELEFQGPLRYDLLRTFHSGDDGIMVEVHRNALPDQQQGSDQCSGQQYPQQGTCEINPKVAERVGEFSGEPTDKGNAHG
jgi:hypothetical protein